MIDRSSKIVAGVQSTIVKISTNEVFSNFLEYNQNGNVYELLIEYSRNLVSRFGSKSFRNPNIHTSGDIFENSIYLLRSIRNFHIFPTFLMKFISLIFLFERILNYHVLLSTIRSHNLLHSMQFEQIER